ncbi:hypothetical protein V1511DRAFT_454230 [Dipodascopsis uninucleata]
MFVFPANDEGYRKRKRAHKACEQCKRRRKRCEPPFKNHERCAPCMKENIPCSLVPISLEEDRKESSVSDDYEDSKKLTEKLVKAARASISPTSAEFPDFGSSVNNDTTASIPMKSASASAAAAKAAAHAPVASSTAATFSDLGNDVSILDGNSRESAARHQTSRKNIATSSATNDIGSTRFIGDLDPASVLLTLHNVEKDRIGVWVKGASMHQPVNQHLLTYLDSVHAFDLPSRHDREGLLNVYFENIHPFLPLFDQQTFMQQHMRDECPTLLLHAVTLAACRHPAARKYITPRSPRQFASMVATKIRALMFAEVERDKLTVTRVLALLSLHSEGSDGLERSCSDLELAFHYAHFLGIHHERRSHPDQAAMRRLWWCLWCLDRISACVSARPLISRLDDVGVSPLTAYEEGWLSKLYEVCKILEDVIGMYRPVGSQLPLEVDVEVSYGYDIKSSPFAALLQLIRHAACILAHKRAPEEPELNASILLHSTSQILHIVKSQPNLPPFPVVPYTVSLCLTVFLRLFPSPEATAGWHESCAVLDNLSKTWWVAEAMGGMARTVFRKLEEDVEFRNAEEALQHVVATSLASRVSGISRPTTTIPSSMATSIGIQPPSMAVTSSRIADSGMLTTGPQNTVSVPQFVPTYIPLTDPQTPQSTGTANAGATPLENQILEMFSDLPNPTSFLDQAFSVDDFADLWIPEIPTDAANNNNSNNNNASITTTNTNNNNNNGTDTADNNMSFRTYPQPSTGTNYISGLAHPNSRYMI